jgi:hypothetical protein
VKVKRIAAIERPGRQGSLRYHGASASGCHTSFRLKAMKICAPLLAHCWKHASKAMVHTAIDIHGAPCLLLDAIGCSESAGLRAIDVTVGR